MAAGDVDLAIANHAEFNRRAMSGPFAPADRAPWDEGALALSDQALLWGGARRVALLPAPPHPLLARDIADLLDLERLEILAPSAPTPFVSRAALAEPGFLDRLAGTLSGAPRVALRPWGASQGLRRLADALGAKIPLDASELPSPEVLGISQILEGKAGFRLEAEGFLPLPEGYVAWTPGEAGEIAAWFLRGGRGAVVKANHGAGGFTVRVFPAGAGGDEVERDLAARARLEGFWRRGPYVVEELLEPPPDGLPGAATSDWRVLPSGRLSRLGTGRMRIQRRTVYSGVCAGRGALPPGSSSALERAGRAVETLLVRRGYRGLYDLDAARGADGRWRVHEVNLRRASPAHAFFTARRVAGKDWERRAAVLAEDRLFLPGASRPHYERLRRAFFECNRAHANAGVLAVPSTATHSLTRNPPFLGFVVVAPDARAAEEVWAELAQRLHRAAGCPKRDGAP